MLLGLLANLLPLPQTLSASLRGSMSAQEAVSPSPIGAISTRPGPLVRPSSAAMFATSVLRSFTGAQSPVRANEHSSCTETCWSYEVYCSEERVERLRRLEQLPSLPCPREGCSTVIRGTQRALNAHIREQHDFVPQRCDVEGCLDETVFATRGQLAGHRKKHSPHSSLFAPNMSSLGRSTGVRLRHGVPHPGS